MKIPAIDKGETIEALVSPGFSRGVCLALENKDGSWTSWLTPGNARKLAAQLVRAADSIRPAKAKKTKMAGRLDSDHGLATG